MECLSSEHTHPTPTPSKVITSETLSYASDHLYQLSIEST